MNAMAVAVSNCKQWLSSQLLRSLSIRTVMPAEAQAAANVNVEAICMEMTQNWEHNLKVNKITCRMTIWRWLKWKLRRIKNEQDLQITNSIDGGKEYYCNLSVLQFNVHFWNDHHEHISEKETWWKCLIKLLRHIPTQLKVKGHKIWCLCSLYKINVIFNNPGVACTQTLEQTP